MKGEELLLVVDMQEGFRSLEMNFIVFSISRLLKSFKGESIFGCYINEKGSFFETKLEWEDFQTEEDQEVVKELEPFVKKKIYHMGYTVLTEELSNYIDEKNVKSIYLCGVYTDVCIIKTAMDLFDKGKNVFVLEDACTSLHGENNHKQAINSLKHIIGSKNVVSVDDVV